jgi:archaellum component FlaC
MKKLLTIFLIFFLVLFTALIKNSTKRIDDDIFTIREDIRGLKKDLEKIKLEYDYLSSAEKLLQFQSLYFDNELIKKDIKNIKIIYKTKNNFEIRQFKFIND